MTFETPRDPTQPPARETLTARKAATKHVTIDDMVAMDLDNLIETPGFLRFIFTIFRDCGMYTGSFHPEVGFSQYGEGRRGLGLDILRRLEHSSSDAHIRVLLEAQPYKEAPNGRRKQYDRNSLDADAGNPDDADS